MALSRVGQMRLRGRLVDGGRGGRQKLRREDIGDRGAVEIAVAEGLIAADHGKRAAVADVLADAVEILLQVVPGTVPEVLEDHQVERLELLLEDLLRREGNERKLVLRGP